MENSDVRFSTDSERELLVIKKQLHSTTGKLELY